MSEDKTNSMQNEEFKIVDIPESPTNLPEEFQMIDSSEPSKQSFSQEVNASESNIENEVKVSESTKVVQNEFKVSESIENKMPSNSEDYTQCENIIKSDSDDREYSLIKLANEMHVLLISDKKAGMSACNIKMGVGSIDEPKEFPGLAHFLEHMLFLGSKKFPDPSEYESHFTKYGGSNNACTEEHETSYNFECSPDGFYEALDRTSSFFKSPLFDEEYVKREIEAVNSEFTGEMQDDESRYQQMVHNISDPESFYNRFTCGSRETLRKEGIREALSDFHSKYYSSNIAFACLYHNESIEMMRKDAIELLSGIENKKVERPNYKDLKRPFGPNQLQTQTKFQSAEDDYSMTIHFILPYYSKELEGSLEYISRLIEHVCEGSLYKEFKSLGWLYEMEADYEYLGKNNSILFSISVELTEKGFKKYKRVCSAICSYLKAMRETDLEEWLHDEMTLTNDLEFKYQTKEETEEYIETITEDFGNCKNKDLLCHDYDMGEFNPERIKEQLGYMVGENSFIILSNDEINIEKKNRITDPYFKCKYSIEKYDHKLLANLTTDLYKPDFDWEYPAKNEYIPKNFDLLCDDQEKNNFAKQPDPIKIICNDECDIWYKPDITYKEPRVKLCLQLYNVDNTKAMKPSELFYLKMWKEYQEEQIIEEIDQADNAGCECEIECDESGIYLEISCFNDSLTKFVDDLCEKIKDFSENFDYKQFEDIKEHVADEICMEDETPEDQCEHWLDCILEPKKHSDKQFQAIIDKVEFDGFKKFYTSRIWNNLFILGYFSGNLTEEKSKEIYQKLRDSIYAFKSFEPMERKNIGQYPVINIPKNTVHIYTGTLENEDEENSAINLYQQLDPILDNREANRNQNACVSLVNQFLESSFYNEIRTEQQLGYSVGNQVHETSGICGLLFSVQGDAKEPNYVSGKIMEFITDQLKNFEKCSEEEFIKMRNAYMKEASQKPLNLFDEFDELFEEIEQCKNEWNYIEKTKEILEKITKDDVFKVYKKLVDDQKILEVHMVCDNMAKKYKKEVIKREDYTSIKGVSKFHKTAELYEDRFPYKILE